MILPLRQRHRRMFAVIGLLLPIAFAAGVAARKPAPQVASLPPALAGAAEPFTTLSWKRADLFSHVPVQVRLLTGNTKAGKYAVAFSAEPNFTKPDLIVYWVAGNPDIKDTIPSNAVLLGAFGSPALPLPSTAIKNSGVLILFSLADQEVVDVSRPFKL